MKYDRFVLNYEVAKLIESICGEDSKKDFLLAIYRHTFFRDEPTFSDADSTLAWKELFPISSGLSLKGKPRPEKSEYRTLGDYIDACDKWLDDNFDLEIYLIPGRVLSSQEKDDFINYYLADPEMTHEWPEEAAERLRRMDYQDFLSTGYWQITAEEIKSRANYTCTVCGRSAPGIRLQTHHLSYRHRGSELFHPAELQCICNKCHDNFHNGD